MKGTLSTLKSSLELQQARLEVCDRLAHRVKDWESWLGGALASITGFFEVIGEITEISLSVVLALQTIRKIGLCYGYPPQTQQERLLGWSILAIATAQTPLEKQQAFSAFYHWQNTLYRQMFDEILEDAIDDELFNSVRDMVFRQAIVYLSEDLSVDNVPFIGSVLGAFANSSFISKQPPIRNRELQPRSNVPNRDICPCNWHAIPGLPG
ncbi:MAG: EcsC family protein [Hydrococcus sp. Prado102]|jgi:hypothetical protein|nr:EcsC family protein [Hydrococcus sp. Prado102]